ncbi:MAG TPA: zinc-ribbon domain-containing protein, partial [Ktedonosporobacter sp.]|nr:zinc-ribbon domain-containing protein [Ktedonosporobacter sp.]
MQCPSCGTPLPAGAQACPSCGRRLSPAPSNYPTYGYSNNIPYAPPGEIPPGQPPSGPQPSATPPPYPYPSSYSNPQLYTQAPPFSDNPYQQFPSYIAQPLPPTQPPPQRRGLTALLIASIVIVVLLFGTVGGFIYYTQVLHPSQQSQTNPPTGTATQPTPLPGGLTPTT